MSWSEQDITNTYSDNSNSQKTNLDTTSETVEAGPSKTRAHRACSSCSQQKLKCNGANPCFRCMDLGFPDKCVYLPSLRGRMRGKRRPPDTVEIAKMLATSSETQLGMVSQGDSFGMLPPERPTMDYVRWKRNASLAETIPTNSTIWNGKKNIAAGKGKLTNVIGKRRRSDPTEESVSGSGPAQLSDTMTPENSNKGNHSDDVADRLTSLPLPGDRNPLAVLAEASATVSAQVGQAVHANLRLQSVPENQSNKDKEGYYTPLHRTLKDEAPHIMNFINVEEAEKLFSLYFTYLHPHLPLLDLQHSSPSAVARRNNFLFNAICCASAKARDPVLWSRLAEFARFEIERIPKEKNIDVVQGHLIYATWNLLPPKHFELDMTWLRLGLAVRTGIDINLHRIASSAQAKDGLPRWVLRAIARTWLGVYITDSTMSAQLGKPSAMSEEHSVRSYIALLRYPHSTDSGKTTLPPSDDLWIAALAEWTQMLTRSIDAFRSQAEKIAHQSPENETRNTNHLNDRVNLKDAFIQRFRDWRQTTEEQIREIHQTGPASNGKTPSLTLPFTMANIRLYQQYGELVVHSFVLEMVSGSSRGDLAVTVIELQSAAIRLIHTYQSSYDALQHTRLGCPDILHTFVTYAAVSLLRLLQPQYSHFGPGPDEVLNTAQRAADMLDRAIQRNGGSSNGQGIFLTKLVEAKRNQLDKEKNAEGDSGQRQPIDEVETQVHSRSQRDMEIDLASTLLQPMNLESFGEMLDQDQGHSIWPPMLETSHDASGNTYDAYLNSLFPTFAADYNIELNHI